VTPARGILALGESIVSGAFTRKYPFVQNNGRRAEIARRPGNMKMRMDIITQIEFRLNRPGYATACSTSEKIPTKRARCIEISLDRRQMPAE